MPVFRSARHLILGLACCVALGATHVRAQSSSPGEYELKAAFLFNFAKFVEWPAARFPTESSPIIIGIYGENPFGDQLQATLRGKTVGPRPIVVQAVRSLAEAGQCHILFVAQSAEPSLGGVVASVDRRSVLTVGDDPAFAERGLVIAFRLDAGRIRFIVNVQSATAAGLRISSKLLNLAQIIAPEQQ